MKNCHGKHTSPIFVTKQTQPWDFLKQKSKNLSYHLKLSLQTTSFPILEYCAPIWDPHLTTEVNKLESLQHQAARFVLNKPWFCSNTDSVTEMLSDLK